MNIVDSIPSLSLDSEYWDGLVCSETVATASFDIRNSGYKIAPVDANQFPAGWHQICHTSVPVAQSAIKKWADCHPMGSKIALHIEPFTRNAAYFENVFALVEILQSHWEVVVVMEVEGLPSTGYTFQTTKGGLHVHKIGFHSGQIQCAESFDGVFLATDLSGGNPYTKDVTNNGEFPVYPLPTMGWFRRSKATFFQLYNQLAKDYAEQEGLDPWHVCVDTQLVEVESIRDPACLAILADAVDAVVQRTAEKYDALGIDDIPFAVVKPASGTFGRGVLMVTNGEELKSVPAKALKNIESGIAKGANTEQYLVQEGIYTRDIVDGCPSEPVVYSMGGRAVGGFYRSHCGKDPSTNLNAPGMVFAAMCANDNMEQQSSAELSIVQGAFYRVASLALQAIGTESLQSGETA